MISGACATVSSYAQWKLFLLASSIYVPCLVLSHLHQLLFVASEAKLAVDDKDLVWQSPMKVSSSMTVASLFDSIQVLSESAQSHFRYAMHFDMFVLSPLFAVITSMILSSCWDIPKKMSQIKNIPHLINLLPLLVLALEVLQYYTLLPMLGISTSSRAAYLADADRFVTAATLKFNLRSTILVAMVVGIAKWATNIGRDGRQVVAKTKNVE